jgi:dipeptidyl aminopeptidase/acylaminoacyl peptidase
MLFAYLSVKFDVRPKEFICPDRNMKRKKIKIAYFAGLLFLMGIVAFFVFGKKSTAIILSVPKAGDLIVMVQQAPTGWGYRMFDLEKGDVGGAVFLDTAVCITAAFSPDRRTIAGTGNPKIVNDMHAFVITTVDLETRSHTDFNPDIFASDQVSWNPQGTHIAYKHTETMYGASALGILDVRTGKRTVHGISPQLVKTPVWNKDGNEILALVVNDTSSHFHVFSISNDTWRRLPIAASIMTTKISRLAEKNLFFFCGAVDARQGLFTMDLDSNSLKTLFTGECMEATVSPAGDKIAIIVVRNGKHQLAIYDVASATLKQYTTSMEVYWPNWL